MSISRICSRCGKKIQSGSKCECYKGRHREYDRYSRDKESKQFYNSAVWIKTKNYALSIDEIDVYLYIMFGEVVAADTVHHVIPLKDDKSKALDIDNLMSLHHDTHSMIEQMYKKDKNAAIERMKRILEEFRGGRGV